MENRKFDIYLVNKKEYEQGKLIGELITLPTDEDVLDEVIERIAADRDNLICIPVEDAKRKLSAVGILNDNFIDFDTLNEYAERLIEIPLEDYKIINCLLNDFRCDIENALYIYEEGHYHIWPCRSMEEIASYIIRYRDFYTYVTDYEAFEKLSDFIDSKEFGKYLYNYFNFLELSDGKFIEIYE